MSQSRVMACAENLIAFSNGVIGLMIERMTVGAQTGCNLHVVIEDEGICIFCFVLITIFLKA